MGIQIWIASILSKVIINSLFDVEARQFDSLKIFLNAKLKISTNEADFIFKPKTFLSFYARIVRGKNRQCVSKYSASQNTRMLETLNNFYIFSPHRYGDWGKWWIFCSKDTTKSPFRTQWSGYCSRLATWGWTSKDTNIKGYPDFLTSSLLGK